MPVALGRSAEKLQDKLRSVLHGLGLECWTAEEALSRCERVVAFTSDMGTELGMAEYRLSGSPFNLFPPWMAAKWGIRTDGGSVVFPTNTG